MKTETEIAEKFQLLFDKAFKERKEKFLSVDSRNCIHNFISKLPKYGKVGFCGKCKGKPCNGEDACSCKDFECRKDEDAVYEDLVAIMRDPAKCGQEYPKLAMLTWVLQGEKGEEETLLGWVSKFFRRKR